MKLDFYATQPQYIDHMAPIYHAIAPDFRGDFYASDEAQKHLSSKGIEAKDRAPRGKDALLVAAYPDLNKTYARNKRPFILMEHGLGITPARDNPGYAGGVGYRRHCSMLLAPNQFIYDKQAAVIPDVKQVVIGTPKLDKWAEYDFKWNTHPKVVISFHWPGKVSPEGGTALRHYERLLPELAKHSDFQLLGHGHPRYMNHLERVYRKYNIPIIRDFDEVMQTADLYINDCSSTAYEFCVTGKPVILLNAPEFRATVDWGIRFWKWTNIGPRVNEPGGLLFEILRMLANPYEYKDQRWAMVTNLFPFWGNASSVAARALEEHLCTL